MWQYVHVCAREGLVSVVPRDRRSAYFIILQTPHKKAKSPLLLFCFFSKHWAFYLFPSFAFRRLPVSLRTNQPTIERLVVKCVLWACGRCGDTLQIIILLLSRVRFGTNMHANAHYHIKVFNCFVYFRMCKIWIDISGSVCFNSSKQNNGLKGRFGFSVNELPFSTLAGYGTHRREIFFSRTVQLSTTLWTFHRETHHAYFLNIFFPTKKKACHGFPRITSMQNWEWNQLLCFILMLTFWALKMCFLREPLTMNNGTLHENYFLPSSAEQFWPSPMSGLCVSVIAHTFLTCFRWVEIYFHPLIRIRLVMLPALSFKSDQTTPTQST